MDSVKASLMPGAGRTVALTREGMGIAIVQKPDSDYRFTMVFGGRNKTGPTAVFDMPAASDFRRQLFPDSGNTEVPDSDVPLYPGAECRAQFGLHTSTFIGFYLTPDSIAAVRAWYVRELQRRGWHRARQERETNIEAFVKDRDRRSAIVNLRVDEGTAKTRIGLVISGPDAPARSSGR
jgi:hypothetical protein